MLAIGFEGVKFVAEVSIFSSFGEAVGISRFSIADFLKLTPYSIGYINRNSNNLFRNSHNKMIRTA